MLTVISPAKRLDFDSPLPKSLPSKKHSQPRLLAGAVPLAEAMSKVVAQVGADGLAKMMSLSPQLGELNAERFVSWEQEHNSANARPALCAFDGDVYQGIAAASFSGHDFNRAQNRLRILSGLYGMLRPLDLIQPYRLEMGTSVTQLGIAGAASSNGTAGSTAGAAGPVRSLPQYWRECVTDLIIEDLKQHTPSSQGARALVNLASPEYAAAVDTQRLSEQADVQVISPRFKDLVRGQYKVVGFYAKRARGAMAGWMVRQNVRTLKELESFDAMGYRFDPDASAAAASAVGASGAATATELVFIRDEPPPPGSDENKFSLKTSVKS